MRMIDGHKAKKAIHEHQTKSLRKETVLKLLDEIPTIDPVHAAGACYCRECLYYCQNNKGLAHPECRFGPWKRPDPNDFCNCGVMR